MMCADMYLMMLKIIATENRLNFPDIHDFKIRKRVERLLIQLFEFEKGMHAQKITSIRQSKREQRFVLELYIKNPDKNHAKIGQIPFELQPLENALRINFLPKNPVFMALGNDRKILTTDQKSAFVINKQAKVFQVCEKDCIATDYNETETQILKLFERKIKQKDSFFEGIEGYFESLSRYMAISVTRNHPGLMILFNNWENKLNSDPRTRELEFMLIFSNRKTETLTFCLKKIQRNLYCFEKKKGLDENSWVRFDCTPNMAVQR